MNQSRSFRQLSPPRVLVIGFAVTILAGAVLLSLPISTESGTALPFIDALFMATSAVCVTGLAVVDPGTTFNRFGEMVILFLIQIGGLGFMTFATFFSYLIGKKIGFRERLILQESFKKVDVQGVVRLMVMVISMTLLIEAVGFVLLSSRFIPEWGWKDGLYYALFHTVSAFTNAGFDLFGERQGPFVSLSHYAADPVVNLTVGVLIILGGIGFIVLLELFDWNKTRMLSLHSKIVLTVTAILIPLGMLVILLMEWENPATLGSLPFGEKLYASGFHAIAPRSGGFSTLDVGGMNEATQFFTVMLMFVGASPGSMGGGIKTTTLAIILLAVWTMLRGRKHVQAFRRQIPADLVYKALTVTVMAGALVILMTMLLTVTEHADLLTALFETVSAFCTVGLSMGLTPLLSPLGKIILIVGMFVGRLGPVTIAYAIAQKQGHQPFRYPEEKPLIG
ncbi:TrkH family potassium uptake protein [Staphylospora marina]|uniref:TrkH family potassium uptake protein n=1 Tax=Staphylospora marina TaxID=2490858 RepID=UPI003B968A43